MKFFLGENSLKKLEGVHPDLVKVVKRAIEKTSIDFSVTEGLRTIERQKELVESGKSQTMKSRHLTGHAVDLAAIVDGKISWEWTNYEKIANAMLGAAAEFNIPLVWGGSWKEFKDGVHFELNRQFYA